MTKVNNPKVKILTGRVKTISRGLIKAFTKPNTKAAMSAEYQPETEMPGK